MGPLARVIVVLTVLAASPAAAQTYTCVFKPNQKTDYIAKQIVLTVDPATGAATAWDSLIADKHPGPIPAKYTPRDGSGFQVEWEVEVPYKRNRTSQADYRVIVFPAKNRADIKIHVPGDISQTTGRGSCQAGS